jgi:DNA-binding NarL/FixJ family response regulator
MSQEKRNVLLIDDQSAIREGLALLINREPDLQVSEKAE